MAPVPVVTTPRLVLRALAADDHDAWRAGHAGRSAPRTPHEDGPPDGDALSRAAFLDRVARFQSFAERDEAYVFGIFRAADGAHLGSLDLSTYVRDERDWANLGFSLHNQHHGRGFAREAIRGVLDAAHRELDYQRIEAAVRTDNPAAIRTCEAAGLRRECVRERFWKDADGWTDHVIFVSVRARR